MGGEIEKEKLGPQVPIRADQLTYGSYLKIEELLSLQEPLTSPKAHDEMLFIVVHQSYELWFKQIIHDLDAVIDHFLMDNLVLGFRLIERTSEIFRNLINQVDILETMTPVSFNAFRDKLNPASGFQSLQFRELEILLGAPPERFANLSKLNPEWKDSLQSRLEKSNLRDAFIAVLQHHDLIKDPSPSSIELAIQHIYQTPDWQLLHSLCEFLIKLDEQVQLWRFRHFQMVERMIGSRKGTGGSLGSKYLKSTIEGHFFQELWDARNQMGANSTYS